MYYVGTMWSVKAVKHNKGIVLNREILSKNVYFLECLLRFSLDPQIQ